MEEERVTSSGFSPKRLARVRDVLGRHIDAGYVPGAVAVVARHGEVHVEAMGNLAFEGAGSTTPMAADTIFRTGSMTKPVVAACAMTLVEDCTLRLDDPVDGFLPELADMTVLADPDGPLEDTVPAKRPITLRDLLAFTLGTGIVGAEPGTIPIADALSALHSDEPGQPPDEWIRRFGTLPLVYQPGERWMYHTAADVTGVLIARATGMSFGDALRERICEPLGMTDTAFSVAGESISRLATAYQRDDATGEIVIEDGPDGYWSRPPAFESGGGGLVSTAGDYLAFASALLAGGTHHGGRVLSRPSVTLMTSDHLTPAQKAVSGFQPGYFDDIGWVSGCRSAPGVRTRGPGQSPILRWPRSAATDGPAYTAPAGTTTPPRT
jgi:CubicO group peptidase (beta-lactamase class C family)